MLVTPIIALGKLVQALATFRGGGTSLPGLVVEKLKPDFAVRILHNLPYGVAVISGTNGKTTTTKIVTELLVGAGLRVFTNDSGSNFMRGVISSLLRKITLTGKLDADIAVLELDEAHAVDFAHRIKPRYSLLLNVMRDQMDRFGEIDYTASLLSSVAVDTTDTIILNREDKRIAAIAKAVEQADNGAKILWYGLDASLLAYFPQDDELYSDEVSPAILNSAELSLGKLSCEEMGSDNLSCAELDSDKLSCDELNFVKKNADISNSISPASDLGTVVAAVQPAADGTADVDVDGTAADEAEVAAAATADVTTDGLAAAANAIADVCLAQVSTEQATFVINGSSYQQKLKLKGIYNAYNAAAALCLVRHILPDGTTEKRCHQLLSDLKNVQSAFGRGESFVVKQEQHNQPDITFIETPVELLLVKNPGGFRLALESFDPTDVSCMIAINDDYADGRDMSWLFDVPFVSLRNQGVRMVSGVRAWDMALRLYYDDVAFDTVEPDLQVALTSFLKTVPKNSHRIYCTYTAMLALRKHLGLLTKVEKVI